MNKLDQISALTELLVRESRLVPPLMESSLLVGDGEARGK